MKFEDNLKQLEELVRKMESGALSLDEMIAAFENGRKLVDTCQKDLESIRLDLKGKSQGEVASVLQYNYPIFTDDFMLRMAPENFESLRSTYKYRREFYIF